MTRFRRPVAGEDLLRSPELQLRHPAERPGTERESCYDEGAGAGFDNISPDAYAERWVKVDEGAATVMQSFVEQFALLGWRPSGPVPTSGVASLSFERDTDERLGILLQGFDEWWTDPDRAVNWDSGLNSLRVHLAIAGTFPDGREGGRIG